MHNHPPRADSKTAQQIKEALAMQRAFGDHAAMTFMRQRDIPMPVIERVLTAPPAERRQF
jgi:hypothetical protein